MKTYIVHAGMVREKCVCHCVHAKLMMTVVYLFSVFNSIRRLLKRTDVVQIRRRGRGERERKQRNIFMAGTGLLMSASS